MAVPLDGSRLVGRDRERYVENLFDGIAAPYDRLNRVISLGRDQAWRRRVVDLLALAPGDCVLDVGTGTGDLAFCLQAALGPAGKVLGVDLSLGMLAGAVAKRQRWNGPAPTFVRGNAAALPVAPASVAGVTMGWCLRNVGHRPTVYADILRALRPGGRFVSVEMSRPRSRAARAGSWLYRHTVMPFLARLAGGRLSAYRYLAASTDQFPDAAELDAELRSAGFVGVEHETLMLGSLAIHVGRKPTA